MNFQRVLTCLFAIFIYDGGSSRLLSSTEKKTNQTTTYLYNGYGERIGTELNGVRTTTERSYAKIDGTSYRVSTETLSAGAATNYVSQVYERVTGLSNDLRAEIIKKENGVTVSVTSNSFDVASSVVQFLLQ